MDKHSARDDSLSPANFGQEVFGIVFQLSLTCLLVASVWQIVESEPQTTFDFRLQIATISVAAILSVGLWIASAELSWNLKVFLIIASIAVASAYGVKSAIDFDISTRLLEPGHKRNGRIFHEALGLSYDLPPNCAVNLVPQVNSLNKDRSNYDLQFPFQLHFGDSATISEIRSLSGPSYSSSGPIAINLVVWQERNVNSVNLVAMVRKVEATVAGSPGNQIVAASHTIHVAGVDAVEFDFVNATSQHVSRQVFLQTGSYILKFNLNVKDAADLPILDKFVQSLRVGSSKNSP